MTQDLDISPPASNKYLCEIFPPFSPVPSLQRPHRYLKILISGGRTILLIAALDHFSFFSACQTCWAANVDIALQWLQWGWISEQVWQSDRLHCILILVWHTYWLWVILWLMKSMRSKTHQKQIMLKHWLQSLLLNHKKQVSLLPSITMPPRLYFWPFLRVLFHPFLGSEQFFVVWAKKIQFRK